MIRGAISTTFNTTAGSNCLVYRVASSGRVAAGSGTRSLEWWPVGTGRRGARCVVNPTDSKARFPALSKLSTGHRTLMPGGVVIEHIHTHTASSYVVGCNMLHKSSICAAEQDNCFASFYFAINACISHVIITLIRYFLIPKSRDLVSHNPGISGLKNGPGSQDPGSRDCNRYFHVRGMH